MSASPAVHVYELSTGLPVPPLRTLKVIRVESAVGRGRSRPLIVEAENGQSYVAKLNHTDKTARRLIVEVIAGQIALILGLPQPEIVLLEIDPAVDAPELPQPDREVLDSARGPAFGSQLVPGAKSLRRRRDLVIDPDLAAEIIWFDSLVLNADRKARNPNLLVTGEQIWLIDNDSALRVHHRWANPKRMDLFSLCPENGMLWWDPAELFLLPVAGSVEVAGDRLAPRLSLELIRAIIEEVPGQWIEDGYPAGSPIEPRQLYAEVLARRLSLRKDFERHADFLRVHGICMERR